MNIKIYTEEDITYFKVDNAEKAYTLGFLWGDAHIRSYKIKSGISNIHHTQLEIVRKDLDQIKDYFNVWGNWYLNYRSRKNRQEQGILTNFNGEFGWFLTVNNYLIKSKSEPTKILSIIPQDLKHYWWRGFIDADGCFYCKDIAFQFSMAGSYGQSWEEFVSLLKALGIEKYQIQQRIHKKSKSSAIRMSNRKNIIILGDYIYSGETLGLKRKYDKFLKGKMYENTSK